MSQTEAKSVKNLANSCNDVLGKLGWKWKPEVGDSVLWKNKPYIIYEVEENMCITIDLRDIRIAAPYDFHYVMRKNLIPILPWEEIERVLEGVGYSVEAIRYHKDAALCRVYGLHKRYSSAGKSRQEATMKAVIKLGEEQTNDSKK